VGGCLQCVGCTGLRVTEIQCKRMGAWLLTAMQWVPAARRTGQFLHVAVPALPCRGQSTCSSTPMSTWAPRPLGNRSTWVTGFRQRLAAVQAQSEWIIEATSAPTLLANSRAVK
jgi:hypothetical protein